jgi:sugar phosphate isomerase/epimerase
MSPRRLRSASAAVLVVAALGCASKDKPAADSAADSAAAATAATPPRPDADMKFTGDFPGPVGVQLYSFREQFKQEVPATLARVRALGFKEVELAGTYGMSAERFKQLLDSVGLQATSMHVGYEQFRDSLPAVLAMAKTLGVKYLGTAWVPHKDGPIDEALAKKTAADFNKWGAAAHDQGIQFFYHAHGYEFKPGPDGKTPMDVLMAQTDSNNVKYEMDVFWISRPGADPVAWLKKYPSRWRLLHLKDMKQGTPTNVQTGSANPDSTEVPLGSGQIDYKNVLKTAKEVGVEKFFIEDETKDPYTTVPQSIKWIEAVKYQ